VNRGGVSESPLLPCLVWSSLGPKIRDLAGRRDLLTKPKPFITMGRTSE
jgi:hypothetical protein